MVTHIVISPRVMTLFTLLGQICNQFPIGGVFGQVTFTGTTTKRSCGHKIRLFGYFHRVNTRNYMFPLTVTMTMEVLQGRLRGVGTGNTYAIGFGQGTTILHNKKFGLNFGFTPTFTI